MNKDDMETVTVGRGSFHQIEIDVDTKGTLIRWEYLSVGYDIGFGLFFKRNDKKRRSRSNEVTTIIPSKRSESHVIPETGFHECEHEGIYILKFDNTYSWTRTKEVRYSVQSLPPDPQMLEACSHSPAHSPVSNGDASGTAVGTTVKDKDEGLIENGVGGMSLEETVDDIKQ
ncbi:PREDICTED: SEC14-like protein 2 [Amphimedon queenslandica]|uniref:GOLD domain-containing protein n=1 Tax=Amphimedon queenslandica TaxID=400682 RepID=A0A1X7VIZ8_AMPQE|nr:PREDICTED: SEC14-like protein 2 [Amphimedon queenslandica]|eukprot:XP_003384214.1 PREDICTED: SEC14-like protein 2 [Amphimedon queenslandica]